MKPQIIETFIWDQIDISLEVTYQVSLKNLALVKPQINGTIIIWSQARLSKLEF